MKTITPVSVWHNGSNLSADTFLLYSVHNDLALSATFYYELRSGDTQVAFGNLGMTGTTYTAMNSSSDSNNYCYTWAASQLGLTII